MTKRALTLLLWTLLAGLLVGCGDEASSAFGDNELTQVAVYLTQTVPTVQAGGPIDPDPNALPPAAPVGGATGGGTGGVVGSPTQPPRAATEEDVQVARAIDGDTIELVDGRSVRLTGINTPESGQPFFNEAARFTAGLVEGQVASLAYDVERTDQFGRVLAYVYVGDLFVNLEVVRAGYANAYTVPPNVVFATAFVDAERFARNSGRGLWIASTVSLNITALNPSGQEWVEITNEGTAPVSMVGFTIKDEANHIYTFPDVTIQPGQAVRVYTEPGLNTADTLFWSSSEPIWNDDGDTAFLRDTLGALVDSFGY